MKPKPNPKRRRLTIPIFQTRKLRNVLCPHYEDCLDEAERLNWRSFVCTECPYKHTKVPIKPRNLEYFAWRREKDERIEYTLHLREEFFLEEGVI